ncbi:MAG: helix-turn-helix domain-containing protein [Magnetococcales bacterium]|nr:helix-turn-helix domain-containing protein [Magnetococcales bacterium]
MQKKYIVTLQRNERTYLKKLISSGQAPARKQTRARVLLKADTGEHGPSWSDRRIGDALEVGIRTVERIRQQFVSHGLEAALERAPSKRVYQSKLDVQAEEKLLELAQQRPPQGARRWSLRKLARAMEERGVVADVSHETVRRTLEKHQVAL